MGRLDDKVCLISGAGFKDTHLAEAQALAVGQQPPVGFAVVVMVAEVVIGKSL